jgi:Domain of unknown function (DUF4304)
MTTPREQVETVLKALVVPWLRAQGFRGSLPHFRRPAAAGIDLFTFQFDRNGGGFVIEAARCPASGITTPWGKAIPPGKVTAWDMHPDNRVRIKPSEGSGTDTWFRFDGSQAAVEACVQQVLAMLPAAEALCFTTAPDA